MSDPRKLYQPKGPVRQSMCATCPFRPDGTGYARNHQDFEQIVRHVKLGLPFYCHQTVLFDRRTRFVRVGGERVPDPELGTQRHWENCKGAVLLKRGELPEPEAAGA